MTITIEHPKNTGAPKPIFIVGLTQRVGTNFLGRLLATHPACTSPSTLHEDFLISELLHLESYAKSVTSRWNSEWGAREKSPELRKMLGNAVMEFIRHDAADPDKRPVLRAPTVQGIEYATAFIPNCHVIVLTRFGPDVIESGMKSFGWKFESACRKWGLAADYAMEILDLNKQENGAQFAMVKYEDLVNEPEETLRSIFEFVGLSAEKFDFSAIHEFPVFGSSVERGGEEQVHWAPVPKPSDFNPLGRTEHWSENSFRRFDWLTGSVSKQLGYDLPFQYRNDLLSRCWNKVLDNKPRLPWRLQQCLKLIFGKK